jgi:hypothetical protein
MTKSTSPSRRLPVGAEVVADGVHFRVWAPKRQRVEVVVEGGPGFKGEAAAFELRPEASARRRRFVPRPSFALSARGAARRVAGR